MLYKNVHREYQLMEILIDQKLTNANFLISTVVKWVETYVSTNKVRVRFPRVVVNGFFALVAYGI